MHSLCQVSQCLSVCPRHSILPTWDSILLMNETAQQLQLDCQTAVAKWSSHVTSHLMTTLFNNQDSAPNRKFRTSCSESHESASSPFKQSKWSIHKLTHGNKHHSLTKCCANHFLLLRNLLVLNTSHWVSFFVGYIRKPSLYPHFYNMQVFILTLEGIIY